MDAGPVFLTPEGHRRLLEELDYLCRVRRPEVAELLRDAKEGGDISDSAGYDEAKSQQAFVEARILHLERLLKRARVIEDNGAPPERVEVGVRVTVVENGSVPETFRIVGTHEADPSNGMISNESPLGQALLGRRVGDTVVITRPDGEQAEFSIASIG
jgi:transcription elongation factor GreA